MTGELLKLVGTRNLQDANLPESVRKAMEIKKLEGIEEKVMDVITTELNGIGNLSEIIFFLWKKYQIEDKTRANITSTIYRLIRKHYLVKYPQKKGIYILPQLLAEEQGKNS